MSKDAAELQMFQLSRSSWSGDGRLLSSYSALHILSRKGMNGMNPSSSVGSHSSFIRPLASSFVSFSPRLVRSLKSSFSMMFLSYSFMISTKSWKPPWSLESLQALNMGKTSSLLSILPPFSVVPPMAAMVLRVGLMLQALMRSPT